MPASYRSGHARLASPPSRIVQRLANSHATIDLAPNDAITFQHTVLCQTSLPYRNPGDQVRTWEQRNGGALIKIHAGEAADPRTKAVIPLGLPYGPKPRLILAYLNREALRTGSPVIDVGRNLSTFLQRLGLDTHGRNLSCIKTQIARLSAAHITLGIFASDTKAITIHTQIVSAFDLWYSIDSPRLLWPTQVQLSREYFESLTHHAVPLDERAIAALSHSAMALDLYAWLAQRLHRIAPTQPLEVSWEALKAQFGWHYQERFKFRQVFLHTLQTVLSQYRDAIIEVGQNGLQLFQSPPPVKGRVAIVNPSFPIQP
ncbi:MAG: plasmid encoded RepA protein [Nitrospirae bacterium]|nr:MAG: plasmid encoded RepA protein [Nitrospirota bacterium]